MAVCCQLSQNLSAVPPEFLSHCWRESKLIILRQPARPFSLTHHISSFTQADGSFVVDRAELGQENFFVLTPHFHA